MGKKNTQLFESDGKWRQFEPNTLTRGKALAFRPLLSQHYLYGIKITRKHPSKAGSANSMTCRLHLMQGGEEKKNTQCSHCIVVSVRPTVLSLKEEKNCNQNTLAWEVGPVRHESFYLIRSNTKGSFHF